MRRLAASALLIAATLQAGAGVAQPARPTPAVTSRPPNIVLVLADDLDGASFDSTALDKVKSGVAAQGAWFPNFLLSQALCCPSRASILLGQYVHNHTVFSNKPTGNVNTDGGFQKFYGNGQGLELSTVATWLRERGYRTGLFGKYLNGYPTGVAVQPQRYIPPGWDSWFVNVGPAFDGTDFPYFNYRANENGQPRDFDRRTGDATTPGDYNTDQIGVHAIAFIQQSVQSGQPFFAYLAPHTPHLPAVAAPRHQGQFAGAQVPRTGSFDEADVRDKPSFIRNLPRLANDPNQIAELDRDYRKRLRSELAIGDLVESVISALSSQGQLGNTYIFFVSDNGFHLGQHRLGPGKSTAYEEDIRVPMAVRGPGIAAGVMIPDLAGNIDLAPTFLHIASGQPDDQPAMPPAAPNGRRADGRSLLALLHGRPVPESNRRQAFLLEHFPNAVNVPIPRDAVLDDVTDVAFADPNLPAFLGLRTKRYTFVQYKKNNEQELYDLDNDPSQLCNLIRRDMCVNPPPAPTLGLVDAFLTRLAGLQTCCEGAGCTRRCAELENQPFVTSPAPFPTPTPTPTPTPSPTPFPTPSPTPPPSSPRLTASPASLAFNVAAGGNGSAALQLGAGGTPPPSAFTLTQSTGSSWLALAPISGPLPSTVTVTANAGALAPGSYNATLSVTGAAGNSPLAVPVTVTVTGGGGGALANGGFESGAAPWQFTDEARLRTGDGNAFAGVGHAELALSDFGGLATQDFTVPCTANSLTVQVAVATRLTSTIPLDKLFVELTEASGRLVKIFATYSNLDQGPYRQRGPFDLTPYRCQTLRLRFRGSPNTSLGGATTFRVDEVSVQ